MLKVSGW